jgi:chloride channel protein, CIC family
MTWITRALRALPAHGIAAFLVAALVVGIFVGVATAVLVWLIGWVADVAVHPDDGWGFGRFLPLVAVPTGLVVSWLIERRWGPGIEGGGVTPTIVGLSLRSGYLSTKTIPAKVAATAATIGTGGSAGREGPVVQIGATIGSAFARYTRFGQDQIRSLVAAGAAAGIAASFNAPIAGMLFAVEVLLGGFAIRHLNAVVVASVSAAVTTDLLVGQERILSAPAHDLTDPRELLIYVVVGLLAVVAAVVFLRMVDEADARRMRWNRAPWLRPVAAGLVVAAVGILEPDVLGTGQAFTATLLRLGRDTSELWWVLLLLAAGKIVTSAATWAGGGSGGTFMPSLFIGAAVGGAVAVLIEPVWGFSDLDPGAFAVVGMAATFAAVARAPLTSIIIVFEITGDYELVLPLMLASSLATYLTDRLFRENAYTLPLARRGIVLPRTEDIDLLDTVTVDEVMTRSIDPLRPDMTLRRADDIFDTQRHHGLPVLDDGHLLGLLTATDIAAAGGPSDTVTVADAMNRTPITATPSMPVSAALARMAAFGVGRLPVVSDDDPRHYVGMFRRASVVDAYQNALGSSTQRELQQARARRRTPAGTGFFEIPVPQGSPAHGMSVRDLDWPEQATLVSIRRGAAVLIPHGDTTIAAGDVITGFGTGEARVEVAAVLEPGRG